MHVLSIPCIIMASMNIILGLISLMLARISRGMREYLPFALLCLSIAFYDVASAGLYSSKSFSEGIFWQRLRLEAIPIATIFSIWFSQILTDQKNNLILKALIVNGVLMIAANAVDHGSLIISTHSPAIEHVNVPHVPPITYYRAEIGILGNIQVFIAVAACIYASFLFLKRYRELRETALLLIVAGQVIFFIGVLNDAFVAMKVYENIYINEYTFFFLAIGMIALLFTRHVNAIRAVEELNENLERKVEERTAEIEKLNKELQHLADFDALTGVHNRRFFDRYFETEITKAENIHMHETHMNSLTDNETNLGLAILDIDNFKHINDNFGHPVGDRVLKEIIDIIKDNIFMRDALCRYGGDEFVILMPKTSSEGVIKAVEKIRKGVEAKRFYFDDEHTNEQVTVSIGVVSFDEASELENDEILKLADDRLLRAKMLGRNRVVADSEESPSKFRRAG